MNEQGEKLKLHLFRLEQCIRQAEKLHELGVPSEVIEEKINEYLDEMLEVRSKIKRLENESQSGEGV